MATANSTGAPSRADHPSSTQSPADVAAHRAASYVHPLRSADLNPNADELLHRVRSPRSNLTVCAECGGSFSGPHQCAPRVVPADVRLTTEVAYLEREQRLARQVAAEIAGVAA